MWSRAQAPRTARRQYDVLRAVFNYAVDGGLLAPSPCRNIKLSKPAVARRRALSKGQLADLAQAVCESYAPMVYVGAMLGLRWGGRNRCPDKTGSGCYIRCPIMAGDWPGPG
jgi:integrase